MSLWDFVAISDGWRRAHDPEAAKELTEAEVADLGALIDSAPAVIH